MIPSCPCVPVTIPCFPNKIKLDRQNILFAERSSARRRKGYFYLLTAAIASNQFDDTADDQKDRPGDVHEAPGQDVHGSQEEIRADQDDEPRYHFVMRAIANHSFSMHFLFFHRLNFH